TSTPTVNVPITVDFTSNTGARNIILDGNNFIIGAPGAFTTVPGGGANGWDRVQGKFPVAVGPHTLTASAEFKNWLWQMQQISQTVSFSVAAGGGGGGGCTLTLSLQPTTLIVERGKSGTTTVT